MFPMGRCYVNSCAASPYTLSAFNSSCFNLISKPCINVNTQYDCCTGFQTNLEKIIISLNPVCKSSFAYVSINNQIKIGGIYLDVFDNNTRNQIRVTSLGLNPSQALSSLICIKFNNIACYDFNTFCQDTDGKCKYATLSSSVNTCCPTCIIESGVTPNEPPPPLIQSCKTACCAKCSSNSSLKGTCFSL